MARHRRVARAFVRHVHRVALAKNSAKGVKLPPVALAESVGKPGTTVIAAAAALATVGSEADGVDRLDAVAAAALGEVQRAVVLGDAAVVVVLAGLVGLGVAEA